MGVVEKWAVTRPMRRGKTGGAVMFCPDRTDSSSAASAGVRAKGPAWSRLCDRGKTPSSGTSPKVGFRPTMPQ